MKCLILIALAVAAANAALAPYYIPAENRIRGQYIVVLEDGVSIDSVISRLTNDASNMGLVTSILRRYGAVLNGFVVRVQERGLDILRSLPGVKYVEEDEVVTIQSRNRNPGSWGIDRIDQKNLPVDGDMNLNAYGKNTHIYVIDTGILPTHNDFGGRAYTSKDMDFVGGGQDGIDCHGHGTHCAGTAAGGVYGVANEANVYGLRTLNCFGSGSKSDSIAALDWIGDKGNRPAVASMSLGGSYSSAQNSAVQKARSKGVVVVVAAGNDNANACNYSPASAPEAITVGATDGSDVRSSFSNYGKCLDLFAPGSSIKSLSHSSNDGTRTMSGTSMACPHVSGIAAVMLAQDSNSENVYNKIVSDATSGVVGNPGTGSTNKLAYCD